MSLKQFDELNADDAADKIPDASETWFSVNQAYAAGDHWQDGDGWTGPMLAEDDADFETAQDNIERIFVPVDVINEAMERHADAVLGRPPKWTAMPLEMGQLSSAEVELDETFLALINEFQPVMNRWLRKQRVQQKMHAAVMRLLWSGRAPMRLFIPPAKLNNGQIPAGVNTFERALQLIHFETLDPEVATVYEDNESGDLCGIHIYTDVDFEDNEQTVLEKTYLAHEPTDYPEIDQTYTRIVRVTEDGESDQQVDLLLRGRLAMHEMLRARLITDAIVALQKKLNHAATAEQVNLSTAGFMARIFLNAQMPGTYTTAEDGSRTFTPDVLTLGAGSANFIVGVEQFNQDGEVSHATPRVITEKPVPPTTFIDTANEARRQILMRAKQAYILMTDLATASGESRLRARGDYEASLATTKAEVDIAIGWVIETAIAFAEAILNTVSYSDKIRVVADAQVDIGVVTPLERKSHLNAYEAGLVSRATTMRQIGIDDPDAELALIGAEIEWNKKRGLPLVPGLSSDRDILTGGADLGDTEMYEPDVDPDVEGDDPTY